MAAKTVLDVMNMVAAKDKYQMNCFTVSLAIRLVMEKMFHKNIVTDQQQGAGMKAVIHSK